MKSLILTAALAALALATATQLVGAQSFQTRPAAEVRLSADPVLSVGMLDGPDLKVAQEDIDRYGDALEADFRRSGDADWRPRFERRWAWERENAPDVFPGPTDG